MFKNKGFVQLQWYAAQNLYFLWEIFGDENRPFACGFVTGSCFGLSTPFLSCANQHGTM